MSCEQVNVGLAEDARTDSAIQRQRFDARMPTNDETRRRLAWAPQYGRV